METHHRERLLAEAFQLLRQVVEHEMPHLKETAPEHDPKNYWVLFEDKRAGSITKCAVLSFSVRPSYYNNPGEAVKKAVRTVCEQAGLVPVNSNGDIDIHVFDKSLIVFIDASL